MPGGRAIPVSRMLLGTSQLVVLLTSPAPKQRTICALGDMSHPHILHPACLAQNLKKSPESTVHHWHGAHPLRLVSLYF